MAKAEKKKLSGRKRDERVAAYIFVAPAVILLIAFLVVPMIYTVYFSGFKYQIMRPDAMKFIGLENYQKLFSEVDIVLTGQEGTQSFHLGFAQTCQLTNLQNPVSLQFFRSGLVLGIA